MNEGMRFGEGLFFGFLAGWLMAVTVLTVAVIHMARPVPAPCQYENACPTGHAIIADGKFVGCTDEVTNYRGTF